MTYILILSVLGPLQFHGIISMSSLYRPEWFLIMISANVANMYVPTISQVLPS